MCNNLRIPPLSIFLAAIFIGLFGAIWYGVIFPEVMMESHGYTPEDYANSHPAWYAGGLIIALLIAWGIGLMVLLGGVSGIKGGIKASIRAVIGFGIPLVSYTVVFSPIHDCTLYAVVVSQLVTAWIVAGAIIGGMTKDSESR